MNLCLFAVRGGRILVPAEMTLSGTEKLPLLFFFVVPPLLWRTSGGYGRGFWACGPRRTTRV